MDGFSLEVHLTRWVLLPEDEHGAGRRRPEPPDPDRPGP